MVYELNLILKELKVKPGDIVIDNNTILFVVDAETIFVLKDWFYRTGMVKRTKDWRVKDKNVESIKHIKGPSWK